MPEGDTVLRTARRLHLALAGRPLIRSELRWPTLGEADLAGREVVEVVSYGKHSLTRIAAADPARRVPRIPTVLPEQLTLRSHLRMEGSWYVHARDAEPWPARNRASVRAVLGGGRNQVKQAEPVPDRGPFRAAEATLIGQRGPDIMADGFESGGAAEAAPPDSK